ncbi:MAG: tRNA pseudouridine(38-40) synthase TruA, partial [Planctomycetota bacterium]|nr:tRNA pseudouridine(38-40) synthase TruA [Planctomycetota bacterium]
MKRIKLTIEYDGTAYGGWQYQENARSIQGELEKAVKAVTGESVRAHGAGRTDAGVHALGQVAHLDLVSDFPLRKLPSALNAHLPKDIAVVEAEEAPGDFHARYSAKGKIYRYRILNRKERGAVERDYAAHVGWDLDLEAMRAAAEILLGRHDFSAFTTDLSGTNRDRADEGRRPMDPVREMRRIEISAVGRYLDMEFEA